MVALSPYDPDWARSFEAERALLERVLAPWLEGGVEHVGSTAVPGIAAKPIVDMVAGVRDLDEARAAYEPLHEVGYLDEPHRPEVISPSRAAASGASDSPSATRSARIRPSRPSTRR